MTDWPNITSMPAFEVKYVSAYIAITIYKMTTAEVLIKYCGNFKYVTVQKDCSATDFLSAGNVKLIYMRGLNYLII